MSDVQYIPITFGRIKNRPQVDRYNENEMKITLLK